MRKPTAIRTLTTLAVLALIVCGASAARATTPQPFTSASQPATITSPLVVVMPYSALEGIFTVEVGQGVTCPDTPVPYTLTLSDPSGTAAITTPDPCAATWGPITPPVAKSDDFTIDLIPGVDLATILDDPSLDLTEQQDGPATADIDMTGESTTPYLIQVSTPAGIVAQLPMTLKVTTTASVTIDQKTSIDQFINVCIDGGYTLYSHDDGDLYCETGGTETASFVKGWPAPKLPILAGPWTANQRGYGLARPTTIFNGGDPTGRVTGIHWRSWGDARAIGTGQGWYVAPNKDVAHGQYARAKIVAFNLGTCHGRPAYNAVEWFFPQHGQHFSATTYIDPCTGAYRGE